ncbi:MAG: hypothetical protein Q9218_008203, partial [Villophora microphyllina]
MLGPYPAFPQPPQRPVFKYNREDDFYDYGFQNGGPSSPTGQSAPPSPTTSRRSPSRGAEGDHDGDDEKRTKVFMVRVPGNLLPPGYRNSGSSSPSRSPSFGPIPISPCDGSSDTFARRRRRASSRPSLDSFVDDKGNEMSDGEIANRLEGFGWLGEDDWSDSWSDGEEGEEEDEPPRGRARCRDTEYDTAQEWPSSSTHPRPDKNDDDDEERDAHGGEDGTEYHTAQEWPATPPTTGTSGQYSWPLLPAPGCSYPWRMLWTGRGWRSEWPAFVVEAFEEHVLEPAGIVPVEDTDVMTMLVPPEREDLVEFFSGETEKDREMFERIAAGARGGVGSYHTETEGMAEENKAVKVGVVDELMDQSLGEEGLQFWQEFINHIFTAHSKSVKEFRTITQATDNEKRKAQGLEPRPWTDIEKELEAESNGYLNDFDEEVNKWKDTWQQAREKGPGTAEENEKAEYPDTEKCEKLMKSAVMG